MKMKPETYAALLQLIREHVFPKLERKGCTMQDEYNRYRDEGHTDVRFLFDLLWAIPQAPRQAWFDDYRVYSEYTDDHIRAALRKAYRDLTGGAA